MPQFFVKESSIQTQNIITSMDEINKITQDAQECEQQIKNGAETLKNEVQDLKRISSEITSSSKITSDNIQNVNSRMEDTDSISKKNRELSENFTNQVGKFKI